MLFSAFRSAIDVWLERAQEDIFQPYATAHPSGRGDESRTIAQFQFMSRPFEATSATWQAVARASNDDPLLAKHFGHLVGSDFGQTALQLQDVGKELTAASLRNIVDHGGNGVVSAQERASILGDLEEFISSDTITFEAIALLPGLQCDIAVVPIALADDVSIILADDRDAAVSSLSIMLLDVAFQQMRAASGNAHDVAVPSFYRHAFRMEFATPKRFGGEHSPLVFQTALRAIEQRLTNCLRALAAVVPMRVLQWPIQIRETGWRARRSGFITLPAPHIVAHIAEPTSLVTAAMIPVMQRAWAHVAHDNFAKNNAAVRVALDRLAGLGTRGPDDQLVDSLIACEAFFTLGHASRQELGFRTALNAAALSPRLGLGDAFTQPMVMDILTRAYDLRSRIVHGDEIREKDRRIAGQVFEVSDFAFWAAAIVRHAIGWAFREHEPGDSLAVKWSDLYFPPHL